MAVLIQSASLGLGTAVLLLLVYQIGSAIYNLYFHPLRSFPGPKLAAISKLPYCVNRCRGVEARWTRALHEQYGDVVRLAPGQLSFISPEAWRDIYGHKIGGKGGMPKDLRFYGPDSAGSNSIIRTNDEDHARQRRLLAHAFSDKALREQEPLISGYATLLISKLHDAALAQAHDQSSPGIDMVRMLNCCTFDIMADLAFGEPLGLLEQSDYTPWVAAIFGALKTGALLSTINANYPTLGALVRRWLVPASLAAKRRTHGRFAEQRVDARLANKSSTRPDIWTFVLRHNNDDPADPAAAAATNARGLRLEEMHANGSVLMIAGTETTATLLSGLTYHLLRNPATLRALTTEIRTAFPHTSDAMTMATLSRLPYLQACLNEGLRAYPPVPVGLPRIVPAGPGGGRVVCGRAVAAGTSVRLSHWAAYRSARNFRDPDAFVPERWLDADVDLGDGQVRRRDARFADDARDVVEPFSYGPRNCIGKNLAYHEMRLILANLLWHFDLELCPESANWIDQDVYTLWEKEPLLCKLKPVRGGGQMEA